MGISRVTISGLPKKPRLSTCPVFGVHFTGRRLGNLVAPPLVISHQCNSEGKSSNQSAVLTGQDSVTIIMVMAKQQPFTLVYADEVKEHLRAIETKYHSLIQSEIEIQLLHEPDVETRNRKPLKRPIAFGADWELRLGPETTFAFSTRLTRRIVRSGFWQSASKIGAAFFSGERSLRDENCLSRTCEGAIKRLPER